MAVSFDFECGLVYVLPHGVSGTFEPGVPQVFSPQASGVISTIDAGLQVIYNLENLSLPPPANVSWDFEHGLIQTLPVFLGDFETVMPPLFTGAGTLLETPFVAPYAIAASYDRWTGALGTFEYGLVKIIPRTYEMTETHFTLAYIITGLQGATIEVSDGFTSSYHVWAYADRNLEVYYSMQGEELGARSLFIEYAIRRFVDDSVALGYNILSPFATFTMTRGQRGHLWTDEFNGDLEAHWQVYPSGGRIELLPGSGVKLIHGDEPVYLLTPVTDNLWALEAKINYRPTMPRDQGGLVVWGTGDERYGFFVGDVMPEEAVPTYFRLVGYSGTVQAWSSYDGETWSYHGAQRLSKVSQVGFGLIGDSGHDLEIEYARLYRAGAIQIYGLYPGMKAVCRNAAGEIVSQATCRYRGHVVNVPVETCPWTFEGTITLYDSLNRLIASTNTVQLQGGDEWYFFIPIEVRFNGKALNPGEITDAGAAGTAHMIELVNKYSGNTPPLRMSLRNLDGTPAPAYIATDDSGRPSSERAKSVDIAPIPPNSYVTFWIINERPDVIVYEESFQYEIVLEVV